MIEITRNLFLNEGFCSTSGVDPSGRFGISLTQFQYAEKTMTYEWDLDSFVEDCVPDFCETTGATPEEARGILGRIFESMLRAIPVGESEIIYPDDREIPCVITRLSDERFLLDPIQ